MKKRLLSLFTILVAFLMITNVSAKEIAKTGENVVQEGNYDSLRLVAGKKVINKANINGLSLIAGESLNLAGSAPYGLYAGKDILVNEKIEKDMLIAGKDIVIGEDAVVGRDLYIVGNTVTVSTNVTRDLRVGANKVYLSNIIIGGDAYIQSDNITLNENTVITGKLVYPEEANIKGLDKATVGSVKTEKNVDVEADTVKDNATDVAISIIASLLTLLALFYILPKSKEQLDNINLEPGNVLKIIGIGFATLIVVPIISLVALFTGVLTPLALIVIAIYVISIYIATLLIYYVVGHLINEKLVKNDNVYLSLIIGVVVVKLIKMIPNIGGLISAFALFYGLGLIFKFVTNREK